MISCIYLSKIGKSYIITDSQTYFTVWCFYHRKRVTGTKCIRFLECNLKNKALRMKYFTLLPRRRLLSDSIPKYNYLRTLSGILISKRCILRNFPIISPVGDHAVVVLKSFSVPSIISRSGKDPPIK